MRHGAGTKFTIDRKLFTSDVWFASPWKLKIWLYLVGNANHKDGEFMGIQLKRGQLIRSYRTIQKDCSYKVGYRTKKPSLHTISRICEDLTKERRIELRKEQSGQIITILNYNELQPLKKDEANDEANDRGTMGEQNKNVKNVKTKTLYEFYVNQICPSRKSKTRAEKNITTYLNRGIEFETLKKAISNYKTTLNGSDPKYRKDPANFFGINEPFAIDYYPENFEPPEEQSTGPSLPRLA